MSQESYTSEEKFDSFGATFKFSSKNILWFLSETLNDSCSVCDCTDASSKDRMKFSLRNCALKI